MDIFSYFSPYWWLAHSIEMIFHSNAQSDLPIYKFDERDVMAPRRQITQSCKLEMNLSVDAWRLVHAVKKADCSRWHPDIYIHTAATGFFLENIGLFDWDAESLCLAVGMSDFYEDFSRTTLSGRIGQGVAWLLLEKMGYPYIGRFSRVLEANCGKIGASDGGKKLEKSPDFIAASRCGEWALAEAKGSFLRPGHRAKIKDKLKKSLNQLEGGYGRLPSPVHRGFAVGTFLREAGDSLRGTSLTAYAETKPNIPAAPVDLPSDTVHRANYASWLSLMGFHDAARRLYSRSGDPEERSVSLFTLGRRKYVVEVTSIRSSYRHHTQDVDIWRVIRNEWYCISFYGDPLHIGVVGLDLDVIGALATALRESALWALTEVRIEKPENRREFEWGEFHGSVFSDGSLMGEISVSNMEILPIEPFEIEL